MTILLTMQLFSPRPWGWPVNAVLPPASTWVFPTPVGMARYFGLLQVARGPVVDERAGADFH